MGNRRFAMLSCLVVLVAFALREWFVLTMTVPEPNQGDVGAYLRYALHLAWDGTFSSAQGPAIPDAFRSPGYPWLLRILLPDDSWADGRWFAAIYQAQAVLGAATVAGVIALARKWMPPRYALLAGVLMALQPHHIAATGAILSEVLFGALLVGALLARGALAGGVFGLAYLTNPVIAPVPFVLAALKRDKAALAMVAVVCIAIGGWAARNAVVDAQGGRAAMNFVQGSWPEYHDMAKRPWQYQAKLAAMDRELAVIAQDAPAGVTQVAARIASEPGRYAAWYASKPFLLFDWDVRIGHGTVYTVRAKDTPLDGPLLGLVVIQWFLNPLLFALAFCGLVLGVVRGGTERAVAVTVVVLTAIHVVLQAEPRYAIPYRSLELLLAVSALSYLVAQIKGSRIALLEPATTPCPT